jgi:gliding motility-associated-like protein
MDDIIIPNVITPNGDGTNDFFVIKTKGLKEFQLTILNRWGNKIFTSSNANEYWDGKENGKPVSDGVYFYILNASTSNKQLEFHGSVSVFN